MTIEKIYELFVLNNTKSRDGIRPSADYLRKYGNVPFEEAFEIYLQEIDYFISLKRKIDDFEEFLISINCPVVNSKSSESRYYRYNGVKYRFSTHVYPTGSMTDKLLKIVDFAADPELINHISY